ncbi:MAG: hypothetical protein EXR60_01775 [Dehalococcoidia bacterium]|nr:hypothetical protein [Dehalococcoidia bacterium]
MQSEDAPAQGQGGKAAGQDVPPEVVTLVEVYLVNLRRLHIDQVREVAAVSLGEVILIETIVTSLTDDLRTRLHAIQGLITKHLAGPTVAFRDMESSADSWPGFARRILYRSEP